MVQLRCNFTLAHKQFTRTHIARATHDVCFINHEELTQRLLDDLQEWFCNTVTHIILRYNVIDHHNIHRLVLGLVSHSQNLCH